MVLICSPVFPVHQQLSIAASSDLILGQGYFRGGGMNFYQEAQKCLIVLFLFLLAAIDDGCLDPLFFRLCMVVVY